MGLILLFRSGVQPTLKTGALAPRGLLAGVNAITYAERGTLAANTSLSGSRLATLPTAPAAPRKYTPDVTYQVAFSSQPLSINPAWNDLSDRLRAGGVSTNRGRSYEFDRMETGTSGAVMGNRDSALSPENTTSPYNPIRSTRPMRILLQWEVPYPLFRGITEGFPQSYPSQGKDSFVQVSANDLFYGLNNSRFVPGATTLTVAIAGGVAQNTQAVIFVGSTALPMPQTVPFEIRVAGLTPDWPVENMSVTQIVSPTQWLVTRTDETTYQHPAGAAIEMDVVSFAPAYSGERIRQVLERVGFDSNWYDLDPGQSLMTASTDLATVSPLEHINYIAEAEFGRFFVSREGLFTFRDRHSIILDYLDPVLTFHEPADVTADEVPFSLAGELSHSEEKLYNRVKITIDGGDYAGEVIDISDQASIDEHFERVFEKTYPYATRNDAESAALYVLTRYSEAELRLPGITVKPASDPENLWPIILDREISERVKFRYQPEGGGDEIDVDMAIDGISHSIRPGDHVVTFQCTEVDSNQYWILGMTGYSELDQTTKVGF